MTDEIKQQLGYIIRETRLKKLNECRNTILIENNPYTKENFCENNQICHYHTLTKLENDIIKEDSLYFIFLNKLNLSYKVNLNEHQKNLTYLYKILLDAIHAGEYIDDDKANQIYQELNEICFSNDIIAEYYLKLIKIFIKFQFIFKSDDEDVEFLQNYCQFYSGIYQGVAYQCLSMYYLYNTDYKEAKKSLEKAKEIYKENKISRGLINSQLIAVNVLINNYYDALPLCIDMEKYYLKTNNHKRLILVYNYLSDYYFLINSIDIARDYFNKAKEMMDNDDTLIRYKSPLYYNWGLRCFKQFEHEEALENFIISLSFCKIKANIIPIINSILIIMSKLQYPKAELMKYYLIGENYTEFCHNEDLIIFKYFRFKLNNSRYYRKYAQDKIIPMLTNVRDKVEVLLFFYEDLYK